MSKDSRICIVVQRYGLEVNGGAELLCRQFAEQLADRYMDVHVVTTKAISYVTWANEYEADEEDINGVHVHRFPVTHMRDTEVFSEVNTRFLSGEVFSADNEMEWIEKQGPAAPALIDYLRAHYDDYDVFVFGTYLYYPTVLGVREVADKAILIPMAHDEPYLRMRWARDLFRAPRALFFNTEVERRLVWENFQNWMIPSDVGGAGIDLPERIDPEDFRRKYGLGDFILYVGRIDESKGCGELFRYFARYKQRAQNNIKLVLMGKPAMEIPDDPDVVSLGFVSDEDKYNGMAAARILINPSYFESLSLVVLEAMSVGTNVIVNGESAVLKDHCLRSNGALWYENYYEFEGVINYLISHPDKAAELRKNAEAYVETNYHWDVIMDRLSRMIDAVAGY